MLVACATAPINLCVDFLFDDVITAPLADDYKVDMQAREVRDRLGRRLSAASEAVRDIIRNSISAAAGTSSALSTSSPPQRSTFNRMSSAVMKRFTIRDAASRQLPPAIVQAHAATNMVLKDTFKKRSLNVDAHSKLNTQVEVASTSEPNVGDEKSPYDFAEKGALLSDEYDGFYSLLYKQCEELSGASKEEFQERWGLNPAFNGSDSYSYLFTEDLDVSSGMSTWGCCRRKLTRRQKVLAALVEADRQANEIHKKLKTATNMHLGLEIIHLFIIDLLG